MSLIGEDGEHTMKMVVVVVGLMVMMKKVANWIRHEHPRRALTNKYYQELIALISFVCSF